MKECLACHSQVEDLRHTCPHCGGSAFWQGGSGPDALSMLDAMLKQAEAAQHVDRGAQLIMQGRYVEAERELREAIDINPLNATAHGNMGAVFDRQGRPEEAIPWLEKALELNPCLDGIPQALAQARAAARKRLPAQAAPTNTPEPSPPGPMPASGPAQPPAESVPTLPPDPAAATRWQALEPAYDPGDLPPLATPTKTLTLAVVSLVAGIVGVLVPPLGALVAIVTGHKARNQIRREPQRLTGHGLASAGLVLGYGQLALIAFTVVALVMVAGLGRAAEDGGVPSVVRAAVSHLPAWPHSPPAPESIYAAPEAVTALAADKEENVYVVTAGGNVLRIDRDGRSESLASGLESCSLSVRTLALLPDGGVVVNDCVDTKDTLVRIDPGGERTTLIQLDEALIATASDSSGNLYLGTWTSLGTISVNFQPFTHLAGAAEMSGRVSVLRRDGKLESLYVGGIPLSLAVSPEGTLFAAIWGQQGRFAPHGEYTMCGLTRFFWIGLSDQVEVRQLFPSREDPFMKQEANGAFAYIAAEKRESLFAFGRVDDGQCGFYRIQREQTPQGLSLAEGTTITDTITLAASDDNLYFSNAAGNIYRVALKSLVASERASAAVTEASSAPINAEAAASAPMSPTRNTLPPTQMPVVMTATPRPTTIVPTPTATSPIVALSLREALDQGVVEAQIQGTGFASGASTTLVVRRLVPRNLRITVDPGTVLLNSVSSEQNMVVRRLLGLQTRGQQYEPAEAIVLVTDESQTYVLEAYCLDLQKDNPSAGASFSLGGPPSPAVSAVLAAIDTAPGASEDFAAIQAAIWATGDVTTWNELAAIGYAPEREVVRSILRTAGLDPNLISDASWQELTDLPRNINTLTVDPVNSGVLYAGTGEFNSGSGVFKSEDGGLTWHHMSAGLPSNDVRALAIRTGQPPTLYAVGGDGGRDLYASVNGAKSWTRVGHYELSGFRVRLAVAPTAGNSLFVAEDLDGVFHSRDGGRTWRQVNAGLPQQDEYGRAYVASLAIDPTDANVVYVGTGWGPHGGNGVFKSVDGGETWSSINRGMLDYTITALAVDPIEPQTVYAGSYGYYDGALFKSTDGGQTWEDLTAALSRLEYSRSTIVDIVIDPTQPRTIYLLDERAGVLVSHDAGVTWDLLGKPDEPDQPAFTVMAVLFGPDPVVVVGTGGAGGWRYGTSQPASAVAQTPEPEATIGPSPTSPPVALPTATRAAPRPTRSPAPPPANCPNPAARITSPVNGAVISGIVPFVGTAAVRDLLYYKIEYKPASSPTWQFLTQVEGQSVTNGKLIDFYTSTIAPGVYDFRLIVVDKSGNYPPPCEIRLTVKR